jgi:membrane protease YdiL (CAAX protease family)
VKSDKATLIKQGIILFLLGFAGVLSTLPLIPQLLTLQPEQPPIPMFLIQLLSLMQTSALLAGMVLLGSFFSHRVNLRPPIIQSICRSEYALVKFRGIILPAILGGVIGGVCILACSSVYSSYLPSDFLESQKVFSPPWYTRILYGGITEEILVRWGLMSFLVWCCFRVTQRAGSSIRPYNYWIAIVLSALIFGAGHLPVAFILSSVVTVPLVVYLIVGNAIFGVIAGYLYWRHGLESAIVAHMIAHVTLIATEA